MLFHTAGFLFLFLPLFLLVLRVAPAGIWKRVVLFSFSYLFYSGSNPFFVLLLLFSSTVDYVVGLGLVTNTRNLNRRILLGFSVLVNLGLLGFYKYGGMFLPSLSSLGSYFGLPTLSDEYFKTIVLPAGISFYTFQSMSYSFDLYFRKIKVERSFLAFLNYVAYLPQLIAGPIERYHNLQPQLEKLSRGETKSEWKSGLDRIALGILQKLFIADSCGFIVDAMLTGPHSLSFAAAWAIAIGFGLQIFYDFSAYSHMAIGISQLVGVKLSDNFLAPYQARNVREFWRRWHITLSTWFRDYLYIPLGGSHGSFARVSFNLMITFLVSGLWHGAHSSFVVWGALHGAYLIIFLFFERTFPRLALPAWISVAWTYVAVSYAWVVFRVTDLSKVAEIWAAMSGMSDEVLGVLHPADMSFLTIVLVGTMAFPHARSRPPGKSGYLETFLLWIGALFALFNSPELVQFIYFQF